MRVASEPLLFTLVIFEYPVVIRAVSDSLLVMFVIFERLPGIICLYVSALWALRGFDQNGAL